jgi:protoheme ferro-lyase
VLDNTAIIVFNIVMMLGILLLFFGEYINIKMESFKDYFEDFNNKVDMAMTFSIVLFNLNKIIYPTPIKEIPN